MTMRKLLLAGILTGILAGGLHAEAGEFNVVQGYVPGEPGKSTAQVPILIKVDTSTGETWRMLVTSSGYWWIPVKNGVLKPAAEEKPADPGHGDVPN
jgi:hypothetical protein